MKAVVASTGHVGDLELRDVAEPAPDSNEQANFLSHLDSIPI